MQAAGDDAGVEWYDSGIGFAVPLTTVNRVLPRLEKGEDLHPGLLGISLKKGDIAIFTTPLAFRWVHFKYAIEKGLNVFMEKPLR